VCCLLSDTYRGERVLLLILPLNLLYGIKTEDLCRAASPDFLLAEDKATQPTVLIKRSFSEQSSTLNLWNLRRPSTALRSPEDLTRVQGTVPWITLNFVISATERLNPILTEASEHLYE
jgi:hypothetical protein